MNASETIFGARPGAGLVAVSMTCLNYIIRLFLVYLTDKVSLPLSLEKTQSFITR